MSQVSEDGEDYDPGADTTLGSFDFPGTFGAEQLQLADRGDGEPDGRLPRRLALRGGFDEDRTFDVNYDVEGVGHGLRRRRLRALGGVGQRSGSSGLTTYTRRSHLADGDDEPLDARPAPAFAGR